MRPVLMAIFVGRHVGDVIDVIFICRIGNKADALGVRHRPGEGLGKGCVTRKLDYPGVVKLIGTKVLLEVVERHRHGVEHALRIKPMRGMVVNLHVDAGMLAFGHGILRRLNREKSKNGIRRLETRSPPIALGHIGNELPWRDRDLIGACRDRDIRHYPIHVPDIVSIAS